MKSLSKQLFFVSCIGILMLLFIGFLIPLIGQQLSIYGISDLLIENKDIVILMIVSLNYFLGFYLGCSKHFTRIKLYHVLGIFAILYIGITAINQISQESMNFFELEISLLLGLALGYLTSNTKLYLVKIALVFCTIVLLFVTFNYTIPLSNQKNIYGNYSGNSDYRKVKNMMLLNSDMKEFIIDNQKDKTIVIDFWNNSCLVCFEKFPKFKELQNEYQAQKNIQFLTINVISSFKEILTAESLLTKTMNQDLNNYFILQENSHTFNISWFPKVVVIKNNEIVFEGTIETLMMFKQQYLE